MSDNDIEKVISKVESIIPNFLRSEVEMVIVGHFKEFEENDTNAFYSDGGLFISNNQTDNADLIDDIIHEIAHSVEEMYGYHVHTFLRLNVLSRV